MEQKIEELSKVEGSSTHALNLVKEPFKYRVAPYQVGKKITLLEELALNPHLKFSELVRIKECLH